jgi:uncharacterized protein YecA (UPF0149 family)
MSGNPMERRFSQKQAKNHLNQIDQRQLDPDEIEAEEEMIKSAEKVEPLKADQTPGRNDPCPCGSGKKYKKCCGAQ